MKENLYIHSVSKKKKDKLQNQFKVDYYEKRIEHSRKIESYSSARLDIIIIALATGGIYIGLNTALELIPLFLFYGVAKTLTISLIVFSLLCISMNILGQYAASKIASNNQKSWMFKLKKLHDIKTDDCINKDELWGKVLTVTNVLTYIFLIISSITLISALSII